MNYIEERPWGMFEVLLDSDDCKVKRITVYPGQRSMYQYPKKRNEVWTVVSGNSTITLDGKVSHHT
jgi:mannose-6-phosphate isomerase-like protein (cupin superfamily)